MKQKMMKISGILALIISCMLILFLGYSVLGGATMRVSHVINIGMLIVLPCILGSVLLVFGTEEVEKRKKIVTFVKIILYITYVIILACLMLLGGRHEYPSSYSIWEYMKRNSNLVPFATITEYVNHYLNHTVNLSIVFENLVGNFMLFVPMGVFLPCLYVKQRTWKGYVSYLMFILLMIEGIQLAARVGSFDVDDLILNLAGACIAFAIVKTKTVTTFLKKIYCYQ